MANEHEIDDGLTDEERAALAEQDDSQDNDTTNGATDAAETTDATGGAAGAGGAAGDGAGDADAAAAAADGQAAGAAAEQPAGPAQQTAPILIAQAPEDADAKLAEIATKKDELLSQFDDGDITAKEYQQQLDALGKQEREIERAVDKAALAAEMEQQRQQNEWIATVNAFIDSNSQYKDNPRLYRALDQEVRDIAVTPEAANWSGRQILEKAHANLAEAFGFAKEQPKPAVEAAAAAKPAPQIPPTLGRVPAADINDAAGGKYAALDRLADTDPAAYEEAIAKLSDAERDAYMAAA